MSVESLLSPGVESIERTCSACNHKFAECVRSYVALGEHLIIQLKRFGWNQERARGTKVSKHCSSVELYAAF
jgi:hypothetical protein